VTFRHAAVFAAATLLAPFSHALVIDFDAPVVYASGMTHTAGFNLAAAPSILSGRWATAFDGYFEGNGSPYFAAWNNSNLSSNAFTLKQTNLETFSLNSFEFSNAYDNDSWQTNSIDVLGYRMDGTTERQTFDGLRGVFGLTTLQLNASFTDLVHVTFTSHGDANLRTLYDNIRVNEVVAAVPEPGSLALLGLGLAGLALHRKRQQA
jgi:hypothetical protein